MLRDHGFVSSISGHGACYDNAMVEAVFKTIKSGLIRRAAFTTRDQASKAIGQHIEGLYNPRRRDLSLGYVSPATFDATYRVGQKEERMALH
jgi:putative transposase